MKNILHMSDIIHFNKVSHMSDRNLHCNIGQVNCSDDIKTYIDMIFTKTERTPDDEIYLKVSILYRESPYTEHRLDSNGQLWNAYWLAWNCWYIATQKGDVYNSDIITFVTKLRFQTSSIIFVQVKV